MQLSPLLIVYLLPLAILWAGWLAVGRHRTQKAVAVLEDNKQAGLMEPNSLHPVIDPAKCLGCAACVKACPEKKILGIIDGKAALIEPTRCVGHGACQTACPTDAIALVFGTATRGVDIPIVSPQFETNVPGIYIAGELGGMGLIRNAIEQGRQAMTFVAKRAKSVQAAPDVLDVLIVGCGPAGISASLGAMEKGLRFRTIDQDTLGGTVAHFPRGKLVMTAPAELPIVGQVKFGEVSKERLLAFWQEVIEKTAVELHYEEQLTSLTREGALHRAVTSKGSYVAKSVLLAIGRRGTPRTLDVPGEDQPKVVYRLIDPEQYAGRKVLVVGGGDSALEAAASIAEVPGTQVALCYRGSAYGRARAKNRDRVASAVADGRIEEMLGSVVERIEPHHAIISGPDGMRTIENDAVLICAGGILPTQFLRDAGIEVETKFGTN